MVEFSTREEELLFLIGSLREKRKQLIEQIADIDDRLLELNSEYKKCSKNKADAEIIVEAFKWMN
jgi:uncharacterized coiled-coil DUF342 family protein